MSKNLKDGVITLNGSSKTLESHLRPMLVGTYRPEAFGAVGDGTTDDLAAINATITAAYNAGGGIVEFDGTKTYCINSVRAGQPGYGVSLLMRAGVSYRGNGCTILSKTSSWFLGNQEETFFSGGTVANVTVNPTAGTRSLTLSSASGFAVGDFVAVRLGDNPHDSNEPRYTVTARITGIVSNTITLDRAIPVAINVTGAVNANNKLVRKFDERIHDIFVEDINFESNDAVTPQNIEGAIDLRWAQNIRFLGLTANKRGIGVNMGAGIVYCQFSENILIDRPVGYKNLNTANQASKGRLLNITNCIDVEIRDPVAINHGAALIMAESYCERVRIMNPVFRDAWGFGYSTPIFAVNQGSEVFIENVSVDITGRTGSWTLVDDGASGGKGVVKDVAIRGQFPVSTVVLGFMRGKMTYTDGTNAIELDCDVFEQGEMHIPLVGSMYNYYPLPVVGRLIAAEVYVPETFQASDVTAFYCGNTLGNGNDVASALVAGVRKRMTDNQIGMAAGLLGTNGSGSSVDNATQRPQFLIATAGTVTSGTFIAIRWRAARVISSTSSAFTIGAVPETKAVYLATRTGAPA